MAIIERTLFLLIILIIGWLIPKVLRLKISRWERIGLSPFLGFGLISTLYFFICFNLKLSIGVWPLISIILVILAFPHVKVQYSAFRFEWSLIRFILVSVSALAILYCTLQSVYWPVWSPDAVFLYDFRAKLLIHVGNFNYLSLKLPTSLGYPPFTTMVHYLSYKTGWQSATWFYPLTFLGFWLVTAGWVTRHTRSQFRGLLTATLIVITPSILWNSFLGLTNILYTQLLTLCFFYLIDATSGRSNIFFGLLSGFLLGLSVFTRMEAFWIIPIVLLIMAGMVKRSFIPLGLFLAAFIPLSMLWPNYTNSVYAQFPNGQVTTEIQSLYSHVFHPELIPILKFMILPLASSWGFLPVLVLALFVWEAVKHRRIRLPMIISLSLSLAVFLGFINFAVRNPSWTSLSSSLYRMATLAVPFFWVAIVTSSYWDKRKL